MTRLYLYTSITELRYKDNATQYTISSPISCTVTEQRNGIFDLELIYPLNGTNADRLIPNAILMASPRRGASEEPFKIYEVEQTIDGTVTVRAHHLVYELDGIIGKDLKSTGIAAAVLEFNNTTFLASYYTWGDNYAFFHLSSSGIVDTTTLLLNPAPISMWAYLGQLVETFSGELSYHYVAAQNKIEITLSADRGTAKDTVIQYGINIVDLDRKLNSNNLYKEVIAWWWDGADYANSFTSVSVPTGLSDTLRSLYLDTTSVFQTMPSYDNLLAAATEYIANHELTNGIQDELTVDFVPIEITTDGGYSDQLDLCDTAVVDASAIGITANAKCIEVVYNILTEKYDSITVGITDRTIVDAIASIETPSQSSSEWKPSTGALIINSPNSSSLASGSYKEKAMLSLPAGTWAISFGCGFSANATGIRAAILSSTSDSSSQFDRSSRLVEPAISGASHSLNGVAVLQFTTDQTLYLNCYQNSGSSLTVYPWIRAVKII